MSHHYHFAATTPIPIILLLPLILSLLPGLPALPEEPMDPNILRPDPASFNTFHPNTSTPVTIPSFPEQKAFAGCPVHLPDQLFPAVKASCTGQQHLSRAHCCPVLSAWIYAAYSATALGSSLSSTQTMSAEMPLLPDDSETCVDGIEGVLRDKGVKLVRVNVTCDVVYCFCGIRLHPLRCDHGFRVDDKPGLVGDRRVSALERDCLSTGGNGCTKCLHSLYSLKKSGTGRGNTTTTESRTHKMRGRDCELMGLTWLLHKDRDAYMSTVIAVMRALMLNSDDSDPISCSLNSNGLPLAVDSVEINNQSSSVALRFSFYFYLSSLVSLIMYLSCYL